MSKTKPKETARQKARRIASNFATNISKVPGTIASVPGRFIEGVLNAQGLQKDVNTNPNRKVAKKKPSTQGDERVSNRPPYK